LEIFVCVCHDHHCSIIYFRNFYIDMNIYSFTLFTYSVTVLQTSNTQTHGTKFHTVPQITSLHFTGKKELSQ